MQDSKTLQFDYLKNEKNFWIEIKKTFPGFKSPLFFF